jgi:hypothetical protein
MIISCLIRVQLGWNFDTRLSVSDIELWRIGCFPKNLFGRLSSATKNTCSNIFLANDFSKVAVLLNLALWWCLLYSRRCGCDLKARKKERNFDAFFKLEIFK